ncbi:bacterio-opsin activator domain-containing protein [Halomontanus rarus]|uniref:helix-turn-helix domain-containing protein n=1 Tax=Halomontanus rarus TaxID=3034020 RepID=UPI0023E8CAD7|nr:bacterio-opsin activator domain-containing protein [Halovivax sp. TS33]
MAESRNADDESVTGVVEVEFSLSDPSYPFVGLSRADRCRFELAEMVPRADGQYAEFFTITGLEPAEILDRTAGNDSVEVELLEAYDDGGLFEFLVGDHCPAVRLAELGALPRTVRGIDGHGYVTVEVPAREEPSTIVETFLEEYPSAAVTAKRQRDRATPRFGESAFRQDVRDSLTDRQWNVIRTAYEAGYYEWPRECTGADVAAELGITSATFSQHIHSAERKLLTMLFTDDPVGSDRA